MLRQALGVIRSSSAYKLNANIFTSATTSQQELDDDAKWYPSAPIIKNIFRGHFNPELFKFPDVESAEELNDVAMMSETVEKFMTQNVDSVQIDNEARIPKESLEGLKSLGVFGIQIPTDYGGLGLNNMKKSLILEQLSTDGSVATTLMGHDAVGAHGILLAASKEQKANYLPKLASGETIGAFCLSEESSGSDAQMMEMTAILSEDGSHYVLNGTKTCVINGSIADIMIVFAKTDHVDTEGNPTERITSFIVEREFGGIHSGKLQDKLGCRGTDTCSVTFENTKVPVGNVLGEVGQGFRLAMDIINAGRISVGSYGAGILKHILKGATDYAMTRKQFNQPIANFQLIKEKIGQIATLIYAIESLTYLTAGLMDEVDGDYSLEAAAVKIFSSDAVWNAASECLQVFGGTGYVKDYPYERILRDSRYMSIHGNTNEILRLLIAGSCMKYIGLGMNKDLVKINQPQKHLGYSMRRTAEMWNCRFRSVDQHLQFFVHEKLAPIMHELSMHTNHFRYIVPEFLALYGRNIIDEQMLISRLTDNAIEIYTIVAVVVRASRSLDRNYPTSDHERDLAYAFSKEALDRIHMRNMRLSFIDKAADIPEKVRIADALMKWHGYAAEHPLTRNW